MTENEITMLMLKLADMGVTGIKVKYEGGGDSGAIEWIGYTKDVCATPEDVNDNIDDWDNDFALEHLDRESYLSIESFAESKILGDVEDWWNNDGGFGELCICIPSGKYIVNNHVRITDTEDFFHDGSLLDMRSDV